MRKKLGVTAFAVAALALASVPAVAIAGKGGHGGGNRDAGPTISLNEPNPALGSWVTFSSSYPTGTKNPRIQVMCYQGDALVYAESGSPDHTFLLGASSSDWRRNGGPASCKADLFDLIWNGNNPQEIVWLKSTTFDAAG